MPGMMRWSCSRGCCIRDGRTSEKRDWRRAERDQLAPWEPWAGDARNRPGPHWLEPEWLLHGYWPVEIADDV
jgi:hypothetical protein